MWGLPIFFASTVEPLDLVVASLRRRALFFATSDTDRRPLRTNLLFVRAVRERSSLKVAIFVRGGPRFPHVAA
jgi:hypothetical protein